MTYRHHQSNPPLEVRRPLAVDVRDIDRRAKLEEILCQRVQRPPQEILDHRKRTGDVPPLAVQQDADHSVLGQRERLFKLATRAAAGNDVRERLAFRRWWILRLAYVRAENGRQSVGNCS